jgi:uncharacterized protein (DUF1800 family)
VADWLAFKSGRVVADDDHERCSRDAATHDKPAMPSQSDTEHLLRRTEFVARPARVAQLIGMSLPEAVGDILSVPADPGSVTFTKPADWQKGEELLYFWLDRMAHDSPRPIQEKMAMFWHGHFCTDIIKVGTASPLRDQINLFRYQGLGNLRSLTRQMSTQVAMLRYLDNNKNLKSSPNQNFARELMELFLLGVGNYSEADVEAGTLAWTGHTDVWATDQYSWRPEWHQGGTKQYLGQVINAGADGTQHGYETIDVVLGAGRVPNSATVVANRGRLTRDVAAEFLSRKFWTFFAGTTPPPAVVEAMRASAVASDFSLKPWLTTMFLRPEFYTDEVKRGLVRSPVDFFVASMVAAGIRATDGSPIWMMEGMGQRPLFPPDVSGWKHNLYFVNPGALSQRAAAAQAFGYLATRGYVEGDGLIRGAGGLITRGEVQASSPEALVDRILANMQVAVGATSRQSLIDFARNSPWWEQHNLVTLVLLCPEFHLA